jgi:nicotinate-nucleotide--dimethylbenzimidazole phosphoribosyltransferase
MSRVLAPLEAEWYRRAAEHQERLTMPRGALGRLLALGRQLCAIQQTLKPQTEPAGVLVFAADHGVVEEGVSAYPQEVTAQMVGNFLRGGAAVSVLARRQGASLHVLDMGVKGLSAPPAGAGQLLAGERTSLGQGTANFLKGPAMTAEQALRAVEIGRRAVRELSAQADVRVLALGEMGIGNTTSASALTAALTGASAEAVTGRGTGLNDALLRHKIDVVERALRRHFPGRTGPIGPLEALSAVGGFEIAGLVGAALEGAACRLVVVLDGFISTVAGLAAARLEPGARSSFIAAHRSTEPGHRLLLEALDLEPLLDLGLRLGEGSGAVLALNLLHCAADIMRDMATFGEARVSDRSENDGVTG